MDKDYCFVVKLTDGCNMNCRYCYHFQHKGNNTYDDMSIETLEKTITALIEHNKTHAHFIWHGGEPLLRDISIFRYIIDKQAEVLANKTSPILVSNGIQTNGTLLTKDFIDFFVDNNFYIGVSLDGDEAFQSTDRAMTHIMFENMMESIRYLNERKARYGILCVVSKNTLINVNRLFEFYACNNINNIGFLPLIITTQDEVDSINSISPTEYGDFLCKYFDIWVNSNIKGISIREFDDYLRYKIGIRKRMCTNTGECDVYYTVTPDGAIYPCDCFQSSESNRLGSVEMPLSGLEHHSFIRNLSAQAHHTPDQCTDCVFREMCQGGCAYYRWLSDKKLERPSYFCIANKMLYTHIDKYWEDNCDVK